MPQLTCALASPAFSHHPPTAFAFLSGAAPLLRNSALRGTDRIGALKAMPRTIQPSTLSWSPFSVAYLGPRVAGVGNGTASSSNGTASSNGTSGGGGGGGDSNSSASPAPWSVLFRPQAELRFLGPGEAAIAAPEPSLQRPGGLRAPAFASLLPRAAAPPLRRRAACDRRPARLLAWHQHQQCGRRQL